MRCGPSKRPEDRSPHPRVSYLRPNGGGVATYAILEELREALQDFRQGGKFVIAYNETYGQGGYYLASVADEIIPGA